MIKTTETRPGFMVFYEDWEVAMQLMEPEQFYSDMTLRTHTKKRVNVYDAAVHVFRHTFLTAANIEGVDLKTLQTIAGHSDSHTTIQVFVHADTGKISEAGNRMNSLLHNLAENGVNMQKGAA